MNASMLKLAPSTIDYTSGHLREVTYDIACLQELAERLEVDEELVEDFLRGLAVCFLFL